MTYPPGEDSFLLKDYLESLELEGKKFLDMGTGSGILAVTAAGKGAEVTAADIDPGALEDAEENALEKGLEIEFRESDLFSNLEQEFEVIVFNPPYLPGRKYRELDGGEKGVEILERFLDQVDRHLEKDGYALFVASSRAELEGLESCELEEVDSRELWFETLYLFKYK